MAQRIALCVLSALLIAGIACQAEVVQEPLLDSDLDALRSQLTKLGTQIKDAEDGENAARKQLEDSRAATLSFESEIANLKASLEDKSTQESTLQQQVALLQSEAQNLRAQQGVHADLAKKFETVNKELATTKDTLSQTLAQLSAKTISVNTAETNVAEAREALQTAEHERDEALAKLKAAEDVQGASAKESYQAAEKLRAQILEEQDKSKALEAAAKTSAEKNQKLVEQLQDLRQQLNLSKMDADQWKWETEKARSEAASAQSEANKAKSAVESAQLQLDKAMQDYTVTQAALIQAESKAQEAMQKMEALLTSWLPHWLDDRYQQLRQSVDPAVKKVQPYWDKAYAQSRSLSVQGQKHAKSAYAIARANSLKAYAVTQTHSVRFWKQLKPTLQRLWIQIQKLWKEYSAKAQQMAGPQWQNFQAKVSKQYKASRSAASNWLSSNPQVKRLRRSLNRTVSDMEKLAIRYLRRVPALKPFAKTPEVTYLVWAVLLAPLFTILVPLLVFRGEKKQERPNLETRDVAIGRGGVTPQPSTAKNGQKGKRARRISVGEESVRVP